MVSTLASGDTSPYVQTKDIAMLYSVVDIAGINSISRQILTNAAGAICGMAQALDMVNFGPLDSVPGQFKDRQFYQHNPNVTLMRTTVDENAELGQIMARKLRVAKGPTTVLIPKQGISAIDKAKQPFYSPEAETAWIDNLKSGLSGSDVETLELDNHINDEAFAEKLAQTLLDLIG